MKIPFHILLWLVTSKPIAFIALTSYPFCLSLLILPCFWNWFLVSNNSCIIFWVHLHLFLLGIQCPSQVYHLGCRGEIICYLFWQSWRHLEKEKWQIQSESMDYSIAISSCHFVHFILYCSPLRQPSSWRCNYCWSGE